MSANNQCEIVINDINGDLISKSYGKGVIHPGKYDIMKGVIVDESNTMIARSYYWMPEYTTTKLIPEYSYMAYYECTVLRFFIHKGIPYMSTVKHIDCTNLYINGKSILQSVSDAIALWDKPGCPKRWEELCQEGRCNVFLLMDDNISTTNHNSSMFINEPTLLYQYSLQEDGYNMIPTRYISLVVPMSVIYSFENAIQCFELFGLLIGFIPNEPDKAFKLVSANYIYKRNVIGIDYMENWCISMDNNTTDEYYSFLPPRMSERRLKNMNNKQNGFSSKALHKIRVNKIPYDIDLYSILELIDPLSLSKGTKNGIRSLPYTLQYKLYNMLKSYNL